MLWTREHRAFAVEAYFSNGRSIVATQRAFRARFNISPRSPIPGRNLILSWVTAFQETGSVVKRILGAVRTARTPENVERVRQSFSQSPRRSACKHEAALRLSDRTVRRILHKELQFQFVVKDSSHSSIALGRRALQIWLHATSSYGVI